MTETLYAKLSKWDEAARKKFTYTTDKKQFGTEEDWRSHADAVLAGEKWGDDCDGLASTVLDLLARDNYPTELLYRAMVSSTGTNKIDHFIGIASDKERLFVVGDTFGPIYNIKKIEHKIIAVSRVSDGVDWYKVNHNDFI